MFECRTREFVTLQEVNLKGIRDVPWTLGSRQTSSASIALRPEDKFLHLFATWPLPPV